LNKADNERLFFLKENIYVAGPLGYLDLRRRVVTVQGNCVRRSESRTGNCHHDMDDTYLLSLSSSVAERLRAAGDAAQVTLELDVSGARCKHGNNRRGLPRDDVTYHCY